MRSAHDEQQQHGHANQRDLHAKGAQPFRFEHRPQIPWVSNSQLSTQRSVFLRNRSEPLCGNTVGLAAVDEPRSPRNACMSPEPARPLEFRPLVDDDIDLVRLWLCQAHIRPWYPKPEEWLR